MRRGVFFDVLINPPLEPKAHLPLARGGCLPLTSRLIYDIIGLVKSTNNPLVSVIIPAYNANGFLSDAINSILNQTYKNLEIIIVDDGSTDETPKILKIFAKKDQRIKIIRNKRNLNIANSLNIGIKSAKGNYIARMDADDISLPHRIKNQMNYLHKHPEIVILGVKSILSI